MQHNAVTLVERLRAHPAVAEVRYPGQGAIVSFIVRGGADAADALCAGVDVLVPAYQSRRGRNHLSSGARSIRAMRTSRRACCA
jgi:cystathionine beta-lyase/cystathionine gamma-synthase